MNKNGIELLYFLDYCCLKILSVSQFFCQDCIEFLASVPECLQEGTEIFGIFDLHRRRKSCFLFGKDTFDLGRCELHGL